jgi:hypothetical protein
LTLTTRDHDFVAPLATGDVRIERVDLSFGARSRRRSTVTEDPHVHGGEGSSSRHVQRLAAGDLAFGGLPIFVSPYRNVEWRSVIDQLAQLGCRRVGILGGEPLLRSDVGALFDHVRARGMACVLTSNGLMVPRRIEKLRGLNTLVLSLDAPGPADDAQRGAGGSPRCSGHSPPPARRRFQSS